MSYRLVAVLFLGLVLAACGGVGAEDETPEPLSVLSVQAQFEAGLAGPTTEVWQEGLLGVAEDGTITTDRLHIQNVGNSGLVDVELDADDMAAAFGQVSPRELVWYFYRSLPEITATENDARLIVLTALEVLQPDPEAQSDPMVSHSVFGERFAEVSLGEVFPVHADRAVTITGTLGTADAPEPFELRFTAGWNWVYIPFQEGQDPRLAVAAAEADDTFVLAPYLEILAIVQAPDSDVDGYALFADYQLLDPPREKIFDASGLTGPRKVLFAPRWLGPSTQRDLLVELFDASPVFRSLSGTFSVDPVEARGVMVSRIPAFDAEATASPDWWADLDSALGLINLTSQADADNLVVHIYSDRTATLSIDMTAPEIGYTLTTEGDGLALEMGWNRVELRSVTSPTEGIMLVPHPGIPSNWAITAVP